MNHAALKALVLPDIQHTYTARDTVLYALALGLGNDPLDAAQLPFVYEKNLLAVPTLAVVLGWPHFWAKRPELALDYARIVHAEQDLRLFYPIPAAGTVIGRNRIGLVADRGGEKGAVATMVRDVLDEQGTLLATGVQTLLLRGDGGFTPQAPVDEPPEPLPALPERAPDLQIDLQVAGNAGFLYRLSGDYNPLHVDPEQARLGGFERPPLAGLCTYGMAAHALLRGLCDHEPARLRRLALRFSAPVFPGDTLRFSLWRQATRDGRETVRLAGRAIERDARVVDRGVAELA